MFCINNRIYSYSSGGCQLPLPPYLVPTSSLHRFAELPDQFATVNNFSSQISKSSPNGIQGYHLYIWWRTAILITLQNYPQHVKCKWVWVVVGMKKTMKSMWKLICIHLHINFYLKCADPHFIQSTHPIIKSTCTMPTVQLNKLCIKLQPRLHEVNRITNRITKPMNVPGSHNFTWISWTLTN